MVIKKKPPSRYALGGRLRGRAAVGCLGVPHRQTRSLATRDRSTPAYSEHNTSRQRAARHGLTFPQPEVALPRRALRLQRQRKSGHCSGGSLAMLAEMRRASSRLNRFIDVWRGNSNRMGRFFIHASPTNGGKNGDHCGLKTRDCFSHW